MLANAGWFLGTSGINRDRTGDIARAMVATTPAARAISKIPSHKTSAEPKPSAASKPFLALVKMASAIRLIAFGPPK